jgi:predicted acyl esterase
MGDGLTFLSRPLPEDTEITGPLAANLRISSSTEDADIFLVFRVFSPDMREVTFTGAIDPHTPIAQGWLRASHRKLDATLSKPYRPYHTHDEVQPLQGGKAVDLAIEIWPTSIVVPRGYRIALSVRGKDYVWQATTGAKLSNFKNELLGCGPFLHDDPRDRPPGLFAGTTTLHIDGKGSCNVMVPIIPHKGERAG